MVLLAVPSPAGRGYGGLVRKRDAVRFENELANMLWERGYLVVRGPSSGSRVQYRFQPDLVAAKNGKILIIEVKKTSRSGPVYIPEHQVRGLQELEERSGGTAVIAVRVPYHGWRFHFLRDLPETRGGRRKVADPLKGLRIYELEEIVFGLSRRIDEFLRDPAGETRKV